ncbi:sigma-70 family RNA polymerase sigma factor [Streptomyces sp. NPDC008313]|uniref:sigma-70 family RNA polymerase sigma factor n=1 Tax=Streptomyces sp. NPDC008313 TaxID=3364826 RepID=UPI0036E7E0DB
MHGITEAGSVRPARRPAPDADRDSFVQGVYDRHGPPLLRYAARLLGGDWHKAEDILQETTARAWKHAHLLHGHDEHIRRWLFTVVRNLVTDHHRAMQLRPLKLMPAEELDVVQENSDHELTLHVVRNALLDLNEQQRTVIGLVYYLECSVAQAAEYLGIPPGTVKSRAFYAIRALRKALKDRGVLAA